MSFFIKNSKSYKKKLSALFRFLKNIGQLSRFHSRWLESSFLKSITERQYTVSGNDSEFRLSGQGSHFSRMLQEGFLIGFNGISILTCQKTISSLYSKRLWPQYVESVIVFSIKYHAGNTSVSSTVQIASGPSGKDQKRCYYIKAKVNRRGMSCRYLRSREAFASHLPHYPEMEIRRTVTIYTSGQKVLLPR